MQRQSVLDTKSRPHTAVRISTHTWSEVCTCTGFVFTRYLDQTSPSPLYNFLSSYRNQLLVLMSLLTLLYRCSTK